MAKLVKPLVLLLTAVLLAAAAFLPRITGAVMDWANHQKANSAPMQSVKLEFGSQASRQPGYMLRRLALEQKMTTTYPIDVAEARMTEEQVFQAMESQMEPYIEAGLFRWFSYTYRMAEPYLCVSTNRKDNFGVIWSVTVASEQDPYEWLFLHIDDETGRLLYLDYVTETGCAGNSFTGQGLRQDMAAFTGIYFDGLNLSDLSDYEGLLDVNVDEEHFVTDGPMESLPAGEEDWEQEQELSYVAQHYTFVDAQYGTVQVSFSCDKHGFYLYIS